MKLQVYIYLYQAEHLSETISPMFISVEAYDVRKGLLSLLYWTKDRRTDKTPYRITIVRDSRQSPSQCTGLRIRHHPSAFGLPSFQTNNL